MKPPLLMGPVVRVAAALLLCSACFQSGRWYQELAAPWAEAAVRQAAPAPSRTAEPAPLVDVGDPMSQAGDIITPLNVRDPSALVIGPYQPECRPPEAAIPAPRAKAMEPLESGRLLELLRRGEKKDDAPKSY